MITIDIIMPNQKFELAGRFEQSQSENLKLFPKGVKGLFKSYTGQSGNHWVSVIPSLNVSGYGQTKDEALEDLAYNFDIFWKDLYGVDLLQRLQYLKELGWEHNKMFKKQLSKVYVDENGLLQNFDNPEEVMRNMYQAA